MRTSLAFVFALVVASPALAQKEFGFDNRKASGQPYLKPEETVAKFTVPPEFEVKLFAGEPQVTNPVAFTIDEKGRVWVVECFEYPKRTPKGKQPRDRIVILEDTDGDGACDKRTVFAEGKDFPVPEERAKAGLGAFDLCTGIEVGHGGVFVGAAPYLWFIENKDGKAGKFEVLLKGFGSEDTHETLNTFQWGPDGWLYGLHGVFTHSNVKAADGPEVRMNAAVWRYHPTRKVFEIFAEGTSNPWGMDWRNTDGQFILCCCVIPHLFHIVPGGIYKRQAGTSFHPYVYGYLSEICDHTFHKESGWAHAGLLSLDVPHMPERFRNSVIFGSIHGCSIKQNILKANGSTFTATRGDDFLQSGDKNFRPINMKWGPLGEIYLIDWHDQYPCHQTNPDDWDYERGRVYRIQLKGRKGGRYAGLNAAAEPRALLDVAVNDPDPFHNRTALRLLGERNSTTVQAEYMNSKAADTPETILRQYRVMTLLFRDVPKFDNQAQELTALHAKYPGRYQHAVRALTDVEGLPGDTVTRLTRLTEIPDPTLRRELASAAIRLSDRHDVTPLVHGLLARKEDATDPVLPQLVWLAFQKATFKRDGGFTTPEKEMAWVAEHAPGNALITDHLVPRLMRRLVAASKGDDLRACVNFVASLREPAAQAKALEGLVESLINRTLDAPEGWLELQARLLRDGDSRVAPHVLKLAVHFRDPAAVRKALATARDQTLKAAERIEAIRALVLLRPPEALSLLRDLCQRDPEAAVRVEAARALAVFPDPKTSAILLGPWDKHPKEVQAELINSFAMRKEWAKDLLNAMARKRVDRALVTDNVILRIQAFKDRELDALIEKAWGRTRPTPAELAKIIDKTRASLHEATGSFERGRVVFETNCGKCHRFDGRGAEVGPPLDGAGRDIEYILGNVLDPNRVIGAPYFVRTARLLDDTVFQGVLAEEDEQTITLKIENAVLKRIKKADLNGPVIVAEKSLMPEGLGYNMTPQDFRDLVRYLMAHPFITHVNVNGSNVAAGVSGRINLPDTKGAPAVVEAEVTSPAEMKTKLLVGSTADYEVRLNGQAVGAGRGAGKDLRPDADGFDVTLPAGKHTLTIAVKNAGAGHALHARLLDPDRRLRYPEKEEKK